MLERAIVDPGDRAAEPDGEPLDGLAASTVLAAASNSEASAPSTLLSSLSRSLELLRRFGDRGDGASISNGSTDNARLLLVLPPRSVSGEMLARGSTVVAMLDPPSADDAVVAVVACVDDELASPPLELAGLAPRHVFESSFVRRCSGTGSSGERLSYLDDVEVALLR